MVIIYKLIKYIHSILFTKKFNVEQLGNNLLIELYDIKEISRNIINDKNKNFIFAYWTTLMKEINIKLKFSTAYHPQINE